MTFDEYLNGLDQLLEEQPEAIADALAEAYDKFGKSDILLERMNKLKESKHVNYPNATMENLTKEMEGYVNTLVLDDFRVVRLIGVNEDDYDFYWELDDGVNIYGLSCVGKWMPLKGWILSEEYDRLKYQWNQMGRTHAD